MLISIIWALGMRVQTKDRGHVRGYHPTIMVKYEPTHNEDSAHMEDLGMGQTMMVPALWGPMQLVISSYKPSITFPLTVQTGNKQSPQ